jgi:DNA-binding NtrC family response regulator
VLLVSAEDETHRRLASIFEHSNWTLHHARDADGAAASMSQHEPHVVISDQWVNGASWHEMCGRAANRARWVVASRLADDPLWQEVLQLGAYNVLQTPFDPREVFWVVSNAWLDWKGERSRRARTMAAVAS